MSVFEYIGLAVAVGVWWWLFYKFFSLVREIGLRATLLAPIWILSFIFKKK